MRIIAITLWKVIFTLLPSMTVSCETSWLEFHDDLATALTLASVDLACPLLARRNDSAALPEERKDHKPEKPQDIILSRKRRVFYPSADPTMTCELRYVATLFPINEELKTSINIELPVGLELPIPLIRMLGRSMNDLSHSFFKTIEDALESFGLDGKSCVLRTICDVATLTPLKPRGIIRDVIRVAIRHLTMKSPIGSSDDESSSSGSYLRAVAVGKAGVSCSFEYNSCPISFLNLIEPFSVESESMHVDRY